MSIGSGRLCTLICLTAHQVRVAACSCSFPPIQFWEKHHFALCIHRFQKTSLNHWLLWNAYLGQGWHSEWLTRPTDNQLGW